MIYEMLSGINPFKRKDKTKFEKLQMITNVEIPYFKVFSPEAKSLLKSLLIRDVSKTSFCLFNKLFFVATIKTWIRRN